MLMTLVYRVSMGIRRGSAWYAEHVEHVEHVFSHYLKKIICTPERISYIIQVVYHFNRPAWHVIIRSEVSYLMDAEKRREYRRQWDRKNGAKKRQYRLNKAIRDVIADIEAGRVEVVDKREIRAVR